MFKTVKKLAKSFKQAWAPRPVLKLATIHPAQVKPAPQDTLDEKRRAVLSTLKAVLGQKMRDPEVVMREINGTLFNYFYGYGDDSVTHDELLNTFHLLNFHGADDFDDDELRAFGACLHLLFERDGKATRSQYDEAASRIEEGNYIHYPQAYDEDTLGIEVVDHDDRVSLPEWLDEYIDYERISEDYARNTNGMFTDYGFFALEDSEF